MLDKYGVGQDIYCYPGTDVLINRLNITDATVLAEAERELTAINVQDIEFNEPPYNLAYLQNIHRQLFSELYVWAGEIRQVDISKQNTRFCTAYRIIPEADKLFVLLAARNFFCGQGRYDLIKAVAEFYSELNAIHPFREGNGRAQRILFEHLVVNCGYQISWKSITQEQWLQANVAGFNCDHHDITCIFEQCIGQPFRM